MVCSAEVGSAKHCGRDFDLSHADQIDTSRTIHNVYLDLSRGGMDLCKGKDFLQIEKAYYRSHYQQELDRKNLMYRRKGNLAKIKDMSEVYTSKVGRPEETIFQVGSAKTMSFEDSEKVLTMALERYLQDRQQWARDNGGFFHYLTAAIHLDETSPHAHVRRVFDSPGKDGRTLGQGRAIRQCPAVMEAFLKRRRVDLGPIEYDPETDSYTRLGKKVPTAKIETRDCNPKMILTEMERDRFQEIVRDVIMELGLDYELCTDPIPDQKHSTTQEHTRQQLRAEYEQLAKAISAKYGELAHAETLAKPTGRLTLALKVMTDKDKLDAIFKQADEYVKHKGDFDKLDDAERLHDEARQIVEQAKAQAEQILDDARHESEDLSFETQIRQAQEIAALRDKAKRYDRAKDLLREKYGFDLDRAMAEQEPTRKRSVSLSRG